MSVAVLTKDERCVCYYSPESGRFLSEDPIGFSAGDQNLYRYVLNNPVKYIDPTGLEKVKVKYRTATKTCSFPEGPGHIQINRAETTCIATKMNEREDKNVTIVECHYPSGKTCVIRREEGIKDKEVIEPSALKKFENFVSPPEKRIPTPAEIFLYGKREDTAGIRG